MPADSPAYVYETSGLTLSPGTDVRFDTSASGGTPAVVYVGGTLLAGATLRVDRDGLIPDVYGDAATVYVRRLAIWPVGSVVAGVLATLTGASTNSPVASPGGAGTDQTARDSVTALAASLPGTYAPIAQKGVDPNDVGYDLILLLGQSNMAGRGITIDATRYDIADSRVFQYGNPTPALSYSGVISAAVEPLLHHDGAAAIGPGFPFARRYAQTVPTNRRVLLVPCAHGGTPLILTNQLSWNSTMSGVNSLYQAALTTAQAALARAGANARIVAALWHQGESDGETVGVTQAAYAAALDALVAKLRTDLGIADLPFVVGQMVPDYVGLNQRPGVNAAHIDTPRRLTRTGFGYGPLGSAYNNGDLLHYSAAGQRGPVATGLQSLSHAMWDGYRRAVTNVTGTAAVVPAAPTITQTSATAVAVSWAQVLGRATDYSLRYSTNGGTSWTALTRAQSIDVTAAITGLTAGAALLVQVATVNEQGTSAWSPSGSLTLLTTPAQVTGLTAGTATGSSQPLSWTAVTGAASYLMEKSADAGSTWTSGGTSSTPSGTVTGLSPSTSYRYRVSAVNVAGTGTPSTTVTSSTASAVGPISVLGLPAFRAYSTRRVKDDYTGNAMLVRRSSDSATQEIPFTSGGDLDTSALLAFAGSGSAFVVTLHDQSGNGFDVTQATTSAQPRIVNAGTIDTLGGKPTLVFASASQQQLVDATNVSASSSIYNLGSSTMQMVMQAASPAAQTVVFGEGSTTLSPPRYWPCYVSASGANPSTTARNDASTSLFNQTGTVALFNGTANQFSVTDTGTQTRERVNGASSAALTNYTTARTGTLTPNRFTLSGIYQGTTTPAYWLNGSLSEVIVWAAALSTGNEATAEANQKTYFGTP